MSLVGPIRTFRDVCFPAAIRGIAENPSASSTRTLVASRADVSVSMLSHVGETFRCGRDHFNESG
jgi:hypothetical protein